MRARRPASPCSRGSSRTPFVRLRCPGSGESGTFGFACAREMAYHGAMASTEAPPSGRHAAAQRRRAQPPAFPGCKPVRLPRTEIECFEGRLEYWDAATETAWICEPATPYHERPSRLLTRLAELVGRVRGSPISYGSMDLLLRERAAAHHAGRRVGVPASGAGQAAGACRHGGGRGRLPRRGAGGGSHHRCPPWQARAVRVVGIPGSVGGGAGRAVPEPAAPAPLRTDDSSAGTWPVPGCGCEPGISRLARRRDSRAERTGAVSANERGRGAGCSGARRAHRPGRRPAAAFATAPGVRARLAHGRAEGRMEGREEGRAEGRARMVRQILQSRGIAVSAGFAADSEAFAAASEEALLVAALGCADEADFLVALRRSRDQGG